MVVARADSVPRCTRTFRRQVEGQGREQRVAAEPDRNLRRSRCERVAAVGPLDLQRDHERRARVPVQVQFLEVVQSAEGARAGRVPSRLFFRSRNRSSARFPNPAGGTPVRRLLASSRWRRLARAKTVSGILDKCVVVKMQVLQGMQSREKSVGKLKEPVSIKEQLPQAGQAGEGIDVEVRQAANAQRYNISRRVSSRKMPRGSPCPPV